MAVQYALHREDLKGKPLVTGSRLRVQAALFRRMGAKRAPFRIKLNNDDLAVRPRRVGALRLVRRLLKDKMTRPGDLLAVRGRLGLPLWVRTVAPPAPERPSDWANWPEPIRDIYDYIFATYSHLGIRYGGVRNCRETRQGGSRSDHSCCRALDVFMPSKEIGDMIVADVNRRFSGQLAYISWWVSLHYDHAHFSIGSCSNCVCSG